MKKNWEKAAVAVAAAAMLSGCAKEVDTPKNFNEKIHFDAWIQTHHPDAQRIGSGVYIIDNAPGSFRNEFGKPEPIADSLFAYVSYTVTDLNGNISDYSEAETAKQLGKYSKTSFYGPRIWTRTAGAMRGGVNEMISVMNRSDTLSAVIPGWLLSYKWYGSEQEYLENESGTNSIYTIELKDAISDIDQWQIDSIGRFIDHGCETGAPAFGYRNDIKELLAKNEILTAADSSDKYGFYFIEIEHGTELEDPDKEDDSEEKSGEEEEKYDWSKSHFFTATGANDTTIYINYVGRLLNGLVFDTNIKRVADDNGLSGGTYEPTAIQWGNSYTEIKMGEGEDASGVIPGFAMTIWRMHPGGKALGLFYAKHGYDYQANGNAIPAYSPLIFEIEVVPDPNKEEEK